MLIVNPVQTMMQTYQEIQDHFFYRTYIYYANQTTFPDKRATVLNKSQMAKLLEKCRRDRGNPEVSWRP
jgi:hypothetical protein